MEIAAGDTVLVNAAAFIASRFRNPESIPCEVLDVQAAQVLIQTKSPYRAFSMWISREWIEATDCVAGPASR